MELVEEKTVDSEEITPEQAEVAARIEAGQIYETICADIGGGVIKLFALSLTREAIRGTLQHIENIAHDKWTRRDTILNREPVEGVLLDASNTEAEFEVPSDLKYKDGDKIVSGGMPYRFDAKKGKMVRDV